MMKTKNILALVSVSLMMITSCSTDDKITSNDDIVNLNFNIANVTRTAPHATGDAANKFLENDKIRVISNDNQTAVYEYDGSNWTNISFPIRINTSNVTLTATYPGDSEIDEENFPIIPTDQSTVEQLSKADAMIGDGKASPDKMNVSIEMHRESAFLNLKIRLGSEYEGQNVKIKNVVIYGSPTYSNPSLEEFKPYVNGNTYSALVYPYELFNINDFLKVEVEYGNGQTKTYIYTCMFSDYCETGFKTNMTFVIGKDKISLENSSIEPWTDGTAPGGDNITSIAIPEVDESRNLITMQNIGSLKEEYITKAMNGGDKLVLSGPMNIEDLKVLRYYMGGAADYNSSSLKESPIKELDMSGVQLEDGILPDNLFRKVNNDETYTPIRKIIIPNNTNKIGNMCFHSVRVKEIVLNDGLTSIRGYAFADCHEITKLEIPEGVKTMDFDPFMNDTKLETLIFPSTIVVLNYCLQGCNSLRTFKFLVTTNKLKALPEFFLPAEAAKQCDLYINKAWDGDGRLDMTTNTFNRLIFKSITLVNDDGTPAQ